MAAKPQIPSRRTSQPAAHPIGTRPWTTPFACLAQAAYFAPSTSHRHAGPSPCPKYFNQKPIFRTGSRLVQAQRPKPAQATYPFHFHPYAASTTVERALQIAPFRAKQSQFPKRQNQRKHLYLKELHQYSAPLPTKKTNRAPS